MLIAFHKSYGVLSQFTRDRFASRTLAEFGFPHRVYPIGRLDADSEGLLLLSDEGDLTARLLDPDKAHEREYWCEVERVPSRDALAGLEHGLVVRGRTTRPARAFVIDPQPVVPSRDPPVRVRKSVPTCWISVALIEGKNRQVRRMTASVGHPTLRLIRVRIGGFVLGDLARGAWRSLSPAERRLVFSQGAPAGRGRPRTPRRA